MVAKVRENFAARKQATEKFNWERSNLRKLSEMEIRKKYRIEIKSRRLRWTGHVKLMGEGRGEYIFWWGNLRKRDPGVDGRIRLR